MITVPKVLRIMPSGEKSSELNGLKSAISPILRTELLTDEQITILEFCFSDKQKKGESPPKEYLGQFFFKLSYSKKSF